MIFHKNINFKFMETELKAETFKDSLNSSKMSKNINIQSKEEEIKNNSIGEEINSNENIKMYEKKIDPKDKIELNDKEEKFKKINKDDKDKKINNKRVNNLLKDIYGSLSNINEVNNKVQDILLKRKKMNSVNSFRSSIKDQKSNDINIKNKRKSTTTNKNKTTYSIIKEKSVHDGYSTNKFFIYNRNTPNNENEITKNETGSVNMKSKSSNNFFLTRLDNDSTQNKTTKNNSAFYYKINSPVKVNLLEKEFNNNVNIKFLKYDDLMNFESSPVTNEKYIEISHINNNTGMYDEEYENEKIIRYMKIKLKDEEKKLRVLEEQKNKLLNEEKLRRKVLMEKIKTKNRIKKQSLINEYKKKINMIQKLQANNINEIRKLEIKKKIDEENIIKVDKLCENININESSLTKSKTDKSQIRNSLTKSKLDNSIEGCNYLLSDNDTQQKGFNKNYSSNYFIYSKNNLVRDTGKKNKNKYNNESEEALTEEYKFNNSINELSSTYSIFEEKESFSNSQDIKKSRYKRKLNFDEISKSSKAKKENINPFNYLFNYYQKVNKSNNRKNLKNENINVDNYLNQNTKKKKYHSENRKYSKNLDNVNTNTKRKAKGSFTPNQDVISFIQTRVNKYNHSSNRESKISKRLSQMSPYPSYLKYDINCKYNYKYSPSSVSNTNVFNNNYRRISQRNEKAKTKNVKELNFKYIFLNHK